MYLDEMTPTDRYTHGHHESVLRSHTWRTAQNSAGFLLSHLKSGGDSLLDVGCGPGTITMDLAEIVAPGRTIGIDRSPEVIDRARDAADARSLGRISPSKSATSTTSISTTPRSTWSTPIRYSNT